MAQTVEQHIFFLTYDLKLGFYKKLQIINTTKIYDYENKNFYDYDKSDNPFQTSYHPAQEDVQNILNVITNREYSIVLNDKDMNWYQEVSKLYKEDSDLILEHKELLYNFLILKCRLCGFSEEFSINFIRHLFKLHKSENIDLKITVEKFDEIIDSKILWIPHVAFEDFAKEKELLARIVKVKQAEGFNFNLNASFGRECIEMCENSFIMHTYLYNKEVNFFNNEALPLKEQYDILIKIYKSFTEKNLIAVFDYDPKWQRFKEDTNYISRFVAELTETLILAMKAWDVKEEQKVD